MIKFTAADLEAYYGGLAKGRTPCFSIAGSEWEIDTKKSPNMDSFTHQWRLQKNLTGDYGIACTTTGYVWEDHRWSTRQEVVGFLAIRDLQGFKVVKISEQTE